MPTYLSLIHWTDQGIKNDKDTTSRAADITKLIESSGGRVRELLWTVGQYDLVTVVDFPGETAMANPASGSVSRQHPLGHDAGPQHRRDDRHHREDRLGAAPLHPRLPAS
jgi:GYD domain